MVERSRMSCRLGGFGGMSLDGSAISSNPPEGARMELPYYSRLMAQPKAPPAAPALRTRGRKPATSQADSLQRRPRPGSLDRPIDGRLYRTFALLVPVAIVLAAFAVSRPPVLAAPTLPPVYDGSSALTLADELARQFPNRSPETSGARGAAAWVSSHLTRLGLSVESQPFEAHVPGRGRLRFENLFAVSPGRSRQTIVVLAHRDNIGAGPGANDNASGTATLIELARAHAAPRLVQTTGRLVLPLHTVVFLSTDGGAFGALGAARFAEHGRFSDRTRAAIGLTALAGPGRTQLHVAGDSPRSPPPSFARTAAARIAEYTGRSPGRPSAFAQLLDLAFPFSLYEQAPFVGRGIPAVTLTTSGDAPLAAELDQVREPQRAEREQYAQIGRAAQTLIGSVDQGLDTSPSGAPYLWFGPRLVRGWAVQLVL